VPERVCRRTSYTENSGCLSPGQVPGPWQNPGRHMGCRVQSRSANRGRAQAERESLRGLSGSGPALSLPRGLPVPWHISDWDKGCRVQQRRLAHYGHTPAERNSSRGLEAAAMVDCFPPTMVEETLDISKSGSNIADVLRCAP
jgi:hypothetical protein